MFLKKISGIGFVHCILNKCVHHDGWIPDFIVWENIIIFLFLANINRYLLRQRFTRCHAFLWTNICFNLSPNSERNLSYNHWTLSYFAFFKPFEDYNSTLILIYCMLIIGRSINIILSLTFYTDTFNVKFDF